MLIDTIPVGVFQCNCTIVTCDRTRQGLVVDPGDEPDRILEIVRRRGVDVTAVLHTHAHLDHIMGSCAVVEATKAVARLHEDDRPLWRRVDAVAASYCIPTPDTPPLGTSIEDDETIEFGDVRAQVIHTPGHTPGSCCFLLQPTDGPPILLSGDTLFRGKVGLVPAKPDRQRNLGVLISSICNRLLTLDDETRVIPGHGPETRIGIERRTNPFLSPEISNT